LALLLVATAGLVLSLVTHPASHGGWSWHQTGKLAFFVCLGVGLGSLAQWVHAKRRKTG